MDHHRFNLLARTMIPSRRSTFAVLFTMVSGLAGRNAGKAKSTGKDCGKKVKERCSSDIETCRALFMASCQDSPELCQPLAACCDTCSANGLFTCLLAQQETSTAARNALRMMR